MESRLDPEHNRESIKLPELIECLSKSAYIWRKVDGMHPGDRKWIDLLNDEQIDGLNKVCARSSSRLSRVSVCA
jgi:hypothetical protein